ncbi:hypothetical protein SD941_02835 [Lactobacillus paragasseri]|uniref:hypothetical protein n=1 Tax=Lactobacillus paragasseri TaxID=2107999 RepID=UPI0012E1B74E|nr:hypothetical protein [Lactobacillus paragasseri]MDK8086528.1 hypothetical protein [Lactobacillus paragasseri]MDX5118043.1 hypothetical protein [Lactobacillus paragasseri]MDX5121924.1 hypothetical protein [Lactobacillus paragasseri]QGT97264.1 hypothetical protein F2Y32_02050 [Lactobacillus paragasseri]UWI46155.1 hypothetical protein HR118_05335 [Lactobacillus paragasseri]
MINKERLNQFIKKIELISSLSKESLDVDEESKKEMIRVLAIEKGLRPDTDRHVNNLDEYFKSLGV